MIQIKGLEKVKNYKKFTIQFIGPFFLSALYLITIIKLIKKI